MLRAVLASILLVSVASAHDLTDPTVKGHSTSVEVQVHRDRVLVDVWIQMKDLAAIEWRNQVDDGDGILAEEEMKDAAAAARLVFLDMGLMLEIPGGDGRPTPARWTVEQERIDLGGERGLGDMPVKINLQFSVRDWSPVPGRRDELILTVTNPYLMSTRLRSRVIAEGETRLTQAPDARETFASIDAGRDVPFGKGGVVVAFFIEVPGPFRGEGDFWTHDRKWVDMATGRLWDHKPTAAELAGEVPPPAEAEHTGLLDRINRVWDLKIRAFLKSRTTPPLGLAILMCGVAFAYGAAHAVGPGHGKTLVAAYLVGSHGRIPHAFLLGLVVTVSHVGIVVAVGVALFFWNINDETVARWIALFSGITIIGMGLWLLWSRWKYGVGHSHGPGGHTHLPGGEHAHGDEVGDPAARAAKQGLSDGREPLTHARGRSHGHGHAEGHVHAHAHDHGHGHAHDHGHGHAHDHGHGHAHDHGHGHAHDHGHGHAHDHGHGHAHDHGQSPSPATHSRAAGTIRSWDLITTGILGGLVPCPAGILILVLALSVQKVAWGLLLLVAFSLGLGGVLTLIGILMLYARRYMASRLVSTGVWLRRVAIASSLAILAIGGVLTWQAVRGLTT